MIKCIKRMFGIRLRPGWSGLDCKDLYAAQKFLETVHVPEGLSLWTALENYQSDASYSAYEFLRFTIDSWDPMGGLGNYTLQEERFKNLNELMEYVDSYDFDCLIKNTKNNPEIPKRYKEHLKNSTKCSKCGSKIKGRK